MTRAKMAITIGEHGRGPATQDRMTATRYQVPDLTPADRNIIRRVARPNPALVLMDTGFRGMVDGAQVADVLQSRLDIALTHVMRNYAGQTVLQRWTTTGRLGCQAYSRHNRDRTGAQPIGTQHSGVPLDGMDAI